MRFPTPKIIAVQEECHLNHSRTPPDSKTTPERSSKVEPKVFYAVLLNLHSEDVKIVCVYIPPNVESLAFNLEAQTREEDRGWIQVLHTFC